MRSEKRWIVLGEDGRHATVGRVTDPSEAEVNAATETLRRTGLGGWLAVMEGRYYDGRSKVILMMVRELLPSAISWNDAVAAFQQRRGATRENRHSDHHSG